MKIFLIPVTKILPFYSSSTDNKKSGMAVAALAVATSAKYFAPTFLAHHILKCSPDEQKFPVLAFAPSEEQDFVLLVLGVRKISLVSFRLYWQK